MNCQSTHSTRPILILLAPGFEEDQIVHQLSYLRDNGVCVSLVGLSTQCVKGLRGIALHPDCSLNQLAPDTTYPLVVMTGGYQFISSLLADPRVHQLLGDTLEKEGYVAANETAGAILPYTNAKKLLNGKSQSQFITQQDMNLEEFTRHLMSLVQI
jgi:putative intracellular protease/amidase